MSSALNIPSRPARHFLPADFKITTWDNLKSYFEELSERPIRSAADLETWLRDRSELESVVSEEMGWRYIRMSCFTDNEEYSNAYKDFVQNIQPHMAPFSDQLNKKAMESPYLDSLSKRDCFSMMIRNMKKEIEIFREANVPLYTEINTETQKFTQISGAMTVNIDGQEMTLQQASVLLMSTDRAKRESVYRKVQERRLQDKVALDELYSKLVSLRHQVARNADRKSTRLNSSH